MGAVILRLIVAAVVVAVYLLRWLYRRSTREVAFVHTVFGGEKVVHDITPVGMNVMRVEVARRDAHALITRNRIQRASPRNALDAARTERERQLDALNIAKRQALEAAEIASAEEVERARIATERGLSEARIARDGDLKRIEIERDKAVELAELQSAIEIADKAGERSLALARAEESRARHRRAPQGDRPHRHACENQREALRLTSKAERAAAAHFAEAQRIAAQAEAEAEDQGRGRGRALRGRGARRLADQRSREHAERGRAPFAPARQAARQDRGHRARERAADGENRGHKDPPHRRRERLRRGASMFSASAKS